MHHRRLAMEARDHERCPRHEVRRKGAGFCHAIQQGGLLEALHFHDCVGQFPLTVEQQEAVIGRTKLENIELDDSMENQKAHKTLATIIDDDGNELDILRDNMPFGRPGSGEFGTYFIGYSARLWVTMRMIDRMFIGDPPGFHDKILDASTAVTGSTFFAPSNPVLQALDDPDSLAASLLNLRKTTSQPAAGTDAPVGSPDGSLGIGSLRRAHDGESAADETEGTAS